MERTFMLSTDFNQFIVFDSSSDWDGLEDKWTPEAVDEMAVVGDRYVAVGTARAFHAPVIVHFGEGTECPDMTGDRRISLPLSVPSGVVVISGITDGGITGGEIEMVPGEYVVTVDYWNLDSIDEMGINGDDRYVLSFVRQL